MLTSDFDYDLPPELIAQHPVSPRDQSRLMILERSSRRVFHRRFCDLLEYLEPGDVVVLNDSRVIPARLFAAKPLTGGRIELLLLEEIGRNDWWAMVRPGKRVGLGTELVLFDAQERPTGILVRAVEKNPEGHCRLEFHGPRNILNELPNLGHVPLPPYINRLTGRTTDEDVAQYQTIYALVPGSVAAPTAGLHFTESLLQGIRGHGVEVCTVTLHVGLGTFAPVKSTTLEAHIMHEERFELGTEAIRKIAVARGSGRRLLAVGTTTVRVLETIAGEQGVPLRPTRGRTRIFITPPYSFKVVDRLLTNFHLPRSTLLMLVSAFASPGDIDGREWLLSAYREAIRERYRFFSYGDAMLIV